MAAAAGKRSKGWNITPGDNGGLLTGASRQTGTVTGRMQTHRYTDRQTDTANTEIIPRYCRAAPVE